MSYEFIEITGPERAVATLRLRRERKKNALCMAMRDEIEDALRALVADDNVHAVVLAGGDGIFCAGYDLKEGMESGGKAFQHRFVEFFEACYLFPKPMVAAVDGPALAGGFDLALMADFIVASTRSVFGHPEIEFGPVAIVPLSRFVSPARVRELCMLGTNLTPEAAKEYGIVHAVVAPEETEAEATRLAQSLAGKPPLGQVAVKTALNRFWGIKEAIRGDDQAIRDTLLGTGSAYADYVGKKLG